MASRAKTQLGVELEDPTAPEAVSPPAPEPEPDERPEWLPENFKSPEEFAAAYKESQNKIREQGEQQKRLESQLSQLSEVVEGFSAPQAPPPSPGADEAVRARLQQSLDDDPIGTIAYLAQQYAESAIQQRMDAMQQQSNPMVAAQQERDNQLLAMMVDQRLGETIDDWDDYRDKVGAAIVEDQSLIPQEVLMNPEATVNAIRRVYQVVKANDILEQAGQGNFVTQQMKRQAQTMSGAGVRNQDVDPADEKMDALRNAVVGASYSAWRGA